MSDNNKDAVLNTRIPRSLKAKLKEYAAFQNVSLSTLVVRVLAEQVGQLQYMLWEDADND